MFEGCGRPQQNASAKAHIGRPECCPLRMTIHNGTCQTQNTYISQIRAA